MLSLLQIHWGFLAGGVSRYTQVLEQLPAIAPIGTQNLCILATNWSVDEPGLEGIRHTRISIRRRLDRSWIEQVRREIVDRRPDLVMTHGFNAHFVAWTCQHRLRRRLPVVCSYHGPYHAESLYRRLLGIAYDRFTEHFFRRHALAVVAVAHHAKARLVRRRVPAEKITVIHNGIEADSPSASVAGARTGFRAQWGVKPDEFLIGAVGRLDPVKGFRHLINGFAKAAQRLPRLRLVIVGDGPERPALENSIRRSGAGDRIRLLGTVSAAAVALPALDLFVVSSLSECHSIALLEAMRAGLPIVATSVGGNPESITPEQEGLVVPPADSEALGAAIARFVAAPELRRKCGEAARQRFLREFTQDVMLKKTAGWLLGCAEKARGRASGTAP
jgi:glycosyltransferase involved in cell wall biosynthesis